MKEGFLYFSICSERLLELAESHELFGDTSQSDLSILLVPLMYIFWNEKCPEAMKSWLPKSWQTKRKYSELLNIKSLLFTMFY